MAQPVEQTVERRDRERDFERFLTFVDAVVAIAITLLVLPLVDVAGELGDGEPVGRLLGDHVSELVAFALSFAVIARLWFVQHEIMRTVVAHDRTATRFTTLWVFLVVLLPFPTALVAEAGDQATTKILYVGTMALSTLCLAGASWAIARNRAVRDSDHVPRTAKSVATAALFVLALVVMLAFPVVLYWPLLLLLLDDALLAAWRRVVRR